MKSAQNYKSAKPTYYCILPVRDGEKSIQQVMVSLVEQTHKPAKIIVAEDGSTDNTSNILKEFENKYPNIIRVIHTDSQTRDYGRLPKLFNMCWDKKFDYYMIAAGDVIFEHNYAEKIIKRMESDTKIVVASGDYGSRQSSAPHGAGRFVKQKWFFDHYEKCPEIVGYESEILLNALVEGYSSKIFHDIGFEHVDQLGHSHGFSGFGRGMRAVGYHPIYAIARCFSHFLKKSDISKRGVLNMFWQYCTYRPKKDGYYSQFPDETREKIKKYQLKLMKKQIKNKIGL